MKNKIAGIFFAVIMLAGIFNSQIYAKEIPDELKDLYAQSAVLMDADSGRILFGKNEDDILPMASTTKIMTCILTLENMENSQIVEVSEYAMRQPKVHLGVYEGEKYYVQDLLYSLMLESHNDSAVAIAEAIGGSVEKFADMMNRKAKEIGCSDTYFITPNGLDEENEVGVHSTTAAELAMIMRYCIQDSPEKEKFLEITQTKSYQFTDVEGKRNFSCSNHNLFLDMMEGALTGKTGFTNDAGYCYVGALRQGKRTFIVALLACGWPNNKGYKWKDTRKLMEYGLRNYEYRDVIKEIDTRSLLVLDGFRSIRPYEREIFVKTKVAGNDNKLEILMSPYETVEVKVIYNEGLNAPLKEAETVGVVKYMLDDNVIKTYQIVTKENIEKKTLNNYLFLIGNELLL